MAQTALLGITLAATIATVAIQLAVEPDPIKQQGPRIQDKAISVSQYGETIPIGAGIARFATNMIWVENGHIREERMVVEEDIGKGGGGGSVETTTYSYYVSAAFLVSQGPATSLCRIWADGKVIYDNRDKDQVTSILGIIQTLSIGFRTFKYANSLTPARLRFYQGNNTQLPDPAIQRDRGVANTPAFRDLCYFVMEDLPLADFGNHVPQMQAEVSYENSGTGSVTLTVPSFHSTVPRMSLSPYHLANPRTRQLYWIGTQPARGVGLARLDLDTGEWRATGETDGLLAWKSVDFMPGTPGQGEAGFSIDQLIIRKDNRVFAWGTAPIIPTGSTKHIVEVNRFTCEPIRFSADLTANLPVGLSLFTDLGSAHDALVAETDNYNRVALFSGQVGSIAHIVMADLHGTLTSGQSKTLALNSTITETDAVMSVKDYQNNWWIVGWQGPGMTNANGARCSLWRASPEINVGLTNFTIELTLDHFDIANTAFGAENLRNDTHEPTGLFFDKATQKLIILGSTDAGGKQTWTVFDPVTQTVEGVAVVPSGAASHLFVDATEMRGSLKDPGSEPVVATTTGNGFAQIDPGAVVFMAEQSAASGVTQAQLDDGTYGTPEILAENFITDATLLDPFTGAYHWPQGGQMYRWPNTLPGIAQLDRINLGKCDLTPVSLETIVERIMDQAGLVKGTDYTLDSNFTATTVNGYRLTRQMTIRQALEPLAFAFLFDIVESDDILKFQSRGLNTVVATIPEDDLGVKPGTRTGGKAGRLSERRTQEIEIPRRVDVTYIDPARDFQTSVQSAQRHVSPNRTMFSDSNVNIEVPVAMSSAGAQLTAEAALYAAWIARNEYEFPLGPKYLRLDAGDLVTVTGNGHTDTVRITSSDLGRAYVQSLKAQSDEPSLYASSTAAVAAVFSQFLPADGGASELFALSVPYLRDQDASQTPQFYMGVGTYSDQWTSAAIQASFDGNLWLPGDIATSAAPWGFILTDIAAITDPVPGEYDCAFTSIDRTATIDLYVAGGLSAFSSITDAQFLNGGNAMAIGDGQLAEIIQFQNVTVISGNQVQLSGIIRGRRGTEERGRAGHIAGTRAVLLRATDLTIQPAGFGGLPGVTRVAYYRARTSSSSAPASNVESVPVDFSDIKPYSPVHVRATPAPGPARTGDITVTWIRQTRVGGDADFEDGITEVPLYENGEAYHCTLLVKGFSTEHVASGKTVTSPSATFTAAERADAGYTADDPVNINVYQLTDKFTDNRVGPFVVNFDANDPSTWNQAGFVRPVTGI